QKIAIHRENVSAPCGRIALSQGTTHPVGRLAVNQFHTRIVSLHHPRHVGRLIGAAIIYEYDFVYIPSAHMKESSHQRLYIHLLVVTGNNDRSRPIEQFMPIQGNFGPSLLFIPGFFRPNVKRPADFAYYRYMLQQKGQGAHQLDQSSWRERMNNVIRYDVHMRKPLMRSYP